MDEGPDFARKPYALGLHDCDTNEAFGCIFNGIGVTSLKVGGVVDGGLGWRPVFQIGRDLCAPCKISSRRIFGGRDHKISIGSVKQRRPWVGQFRIQAKGIFDEVHELIPIGVGEFTTDGCIRELRRAENAETPGIERLILDGDRGLLRGITDDRKVGTYFDTNRSITLGKGVGNRRKLQADG